MLDRMDQVLEFTATMEDVGHIRAVNTDPNEADE